MSRCNPKSLVLVGAITVGIAADSLAQDVANGEHLFRNDCGICHSPQPGRNLTGPSLFNVINRHSGQIADYRYSDANRQSGLTWNVATLDRYLTAPRELVPGTKMTFPGVKDAKQRADLIAYLATLH